MVRQQLHDTSDIVRPRHLATETDADVALQKRRMAGGSEALLRDAAAMGGCHLWMVGCSTPWVGVVLWEWECSGML